MRLTPFLLSMLLLSTCLAEQQSTLLFHDGFEHGLGGWDEAVDCSLSAAESYSGNYSARLGFRRFSVQYLMRRVGAEEQPTGSFVFEFHVKLVRSSMEAVTLAALVFPTGPVAVAVSKDGRVGLGFGLFEPPVYGGLKLKRGVWVKVQLHIDYEGERVELYLDDEKALETGLRGRTLPLQEIWIGTIWLGGAGGYGMVMEAYYDDVALGGEELLNPKPPINLIAAAAASAIIGMEFMPLPPS